MLHVEECGSYFHCARFWFVLTGLGFDFIKPTPVADRQSSAAGSRVENRVDNKIAKNVVINKHLTSF